MLVIVLQLVVFVVFFYSQHILITQVLEDLGVLEKNSYETSSVGLHFFNVKELFFPVLLRSVKNQKTLIRYCVYGNLLTLTIGPVFAVAVSVLLLLRGMDSVYASLGLIVPYSVLIIYDAILIVWAYVLDKN